MKLWLLKPREDLLSGDNPWDPWYDKAFGFVVRAENEAEARTLANENGGDEVHTRYSDAHDAKYVPWLTPRYSSCVELIADGDPGIVLQDMQMA
jgi:hypothetical protein